MEFLSIYWIRTKIQEYLSPGDIFSLASTCKTLYLQKLHYISAGPEEHHPNRDGYIRLEMTTNDLSGLPFVRWIDLTGVKNIKDISCLYRCQIVILDHTDVKDVSALNRVTRLSMESCGRVEGIENLTLLEDLNLTGCSGPKSFFNFKKLHTLNLFGYRTEVITKSLSGIRRLTLDHCKWVTDLSELKGIKELSVAFCTNLLYLPIGPFKKLNMAGLDIMCEVLLKVKNVEDINISMTGITDVSNLADSSIKKLNLSHNPYIDGLSFLNNVSDLRFDGCSNLVDLRIFKSVEVLFLSRCNNVKQIPYLPKLRRLTLINMPNLETIDDLGTVESVTIIRCPNITDFSGLSKSKRTIIFNPAEWKY